GIIGTLLFLKQIFRVDPAQEAREFRAANRPKAEPLERRTLIVANPNLDGMRLDQITGRAEAGVTFSRLCHGGEIHTATDASVIHIDDRILAVGTRAGLDHVQQVIGKRCDEDLVLAESGLTSKQIVVTDSDVLGKSIEELNLDERFGVAATRVNRAGI